jgi:hypothetical protein
MRTKPRRIVPGVHYPEIRMCDFCGQVRACLIVGVRDEVRSECSPCSVVRLGEDGAIAALTRRMARCGLSADEIEIITRNSRW